MKHAVVLGLALCLLQAPLSQAYEIPDIPEDRSWIQDYAGLIDPADREAIQTSMVRAGQNHSTAIMVVTINRMSDFVDAEPGPVIEDLAREWFDAWEIGDADYNTGILVLIAKGDRKARIELGAGWGRRWDGYCQRVMDTRLVANFKRSDFSGGIREGVIHLETMAARGPEGAIPEPGFLEKLQNTELARKVDTYQPMPFWAATLCLLGGIACVVGGFVTPDRDLAFRLLVGGGLLILTAISLYLLIFVFGLFSKGGSGSSSSGFGGGGFSGGGGASGSW